MGVNGKGLDRLSYEELIQTVRQKGNACPELDELFKRVAPLINAKAMLFASQPEDIEDYRQEGAVGFLGALRTWREDGGASFPTYVCTCAVNRMKNLYRKQAVPDGVDIVPLDDKMVEQLPDYSSDTALLQEDAEAFAEIKKFIRSRLSEDELSILDSYISGRSYKQTADLFGITVKAVDNTMQRIRRKLSPLRR